MKEISQEENSEIKNISLNPEEQRSEDLLIKDALFVRHEGSLVKLKHVDILWLKGDGNYTTIVARNSVFSVRNLLKDFEDVLPPDQYIRIHKSYIARIDEINNQISNLKTQQNEQVQSKRTGDRTRRTDSGKITPLEGSPSINGVKGPDPQLVAVAEEYAAFKKALDEWALVRDQWVADRKQRLLLKWEETTFRLRLKQIEQGLRIQRRRLRAMTRAHA